MTNGFHLICSGALRSVEQEYLDNIIRCTVEEDTSGDDDNDTDDNVCLLTCVRIFVMCAVVVFIKLCCCDLVDTHC